MDVITNNAYIPLIDNELDELSFCDSNIKGLKRWLEALPMANVGESAKQLYVAVQDVEQLSLKPKDKVAFLEVLRPALLYIGDTLDRKYLANKIRLDHSQRRIANLAISLENHLSAGYKEVIADFCERKPRKLKDFQMTALQRFIMMLSRELLRYCQLYLPVPEGLWAEIHNAYAIALAFKVEDQQVKDEKYHLRKSMSLRELYNRTLLLGSCQPNQLLQSELSYVFELLENWSAHCDIHEQGSAECSLLIDKTGDSNPFFLHLVSASSISEMRGINTHNLVEKMREAAEVRARSGLDANTDLPMTMKISNQLLVHLIQAWSSKKQRHYKRLETQGHIKMIVGMTAIHYFLSKQTPFVDFIKNNVEKGSGYDVNELKENQFSSAQTQTFIDGKDVWNKAFDSDKLNDEMAIDAGDLSRSVEHHHVHEADLVNVSPKGVCIEWHDDNASLKTGELLAVHEAGKKRWNIGLIRWIRQNVSGGARLGVELIASEVAPIVAQKSNGTGEYIRALLIAHDKDFGGNETLLVPATRYKTNDKLSVWRSNTEKRYLLERRILTSSSISQYLLRAQEVGAQSSQPKDFDNIWQNL
jgi:cyclic-di-GMP-binding protein